MKNKIALIGVLIFFNTIQSQNIQVVQVAFTQTLYPKKTLPSNVKNYNCTVSTPYLKDDSSFREIAEKQYQKELQNFPNVIKESQKNYDEIILVDYAKSVEEAKVKYKLESEQFNKMSALERLALIDQKPVLRIPEKPTFVRPPEPRLENVNTNGVIIFNPETLAKNYIKLNGFGHGTDGLQININFTGFEYIEPVAAIVDVENYNPQTKEKFYTKQTQFVTKFRHPTTLKVQLNSTDLVSGVFDKTAAYQSMETNAPPTRINIEKQEVEKIMTNINAFLNDQYGYTKVNREAVLFTVKNKKGEYDDVEKAKDFALSGYKNYSENQVEAIKDIENAIKIWEKTITEVNYEDNKARIDEKVGTAILKNLVFASIIINEFDKAEKYMADLKKLRLNYEDKQFVEEYTKLSVDLKSRYKGK